MDGELKEKEEREMNARAEYYIEYVEWGWPGYAWPTGKSLDGFVKWLVENDPDLPPIGDSNALSETDYSAMDRALNGYLATSPTEEA